MSWYVEVLLLNKDIIKTKSALESDELLDLILVEKSLSSLKEDGLFTDEELQVISTMETSANFFIAASTLNLSRITISKIFRKACSKISYKLGSYFTDDGYLSYLSDKYSLTDKQIETLRRYMNSKFRYKLARQIFKNEDYIEGDDECE